MPLMLSDSSFDGSIGLIHVNSTTITPKPVSLVLREIAAFAIAVSRHTNKKWRFTGLRRPSTALVIAATVFHQRPDRDDMKTARPSQG